MKTLFIFLITITSLSNINVQDLKTERLVFIQVEEEYVYFSNEEEENIEFLINSSVLEKIDLSNTSYKGKEFDVTYESQTEYDEFDEEYEIRTITNLNLVE